MRLWLVTLATIMPIAPAVAQDGPPGPSEGPAWTVSAGPGVLAVPRFPGSGDLRVLPVPAFDIRYRDLFFASIQSGIGFNLVRTRPITAGPLVRPDFGRLSSDARRDLRGLDRVDFAPEFGGFVQADLSRTLSLRAEARQAVGGHGGLVADFSATYARPIGHSAFIAIGPRLRLTDSRYQRAYFGITPTQAARTGFSTFSPGGGLTSMGFGGVISVPVAKRLDLAFAAGYDRLVDDPARSPIVRSTKGSRDQPVLALSLSYAFTRRARP